MPGGIEIKTRDEIGYMREASLIVYEVLEELTRAVAPGVTLEELDAIAERETVRRGGVCAFKGLYGFPKNVCISVDEQVVHGIPTRRRLVEGDLLKLDYGVINLGTHEVDTLPDGWTVVTRDGKLSSHWEHTIAVTDNGPEVLTRP